MQFDTASRFLFRYWNFWHFSVLPSFCYFQAIERAMSAFGTLRVPALSCWCSVRARQGVGTAVSFKLSDFRPRSGPRPGPRGLICLASGGCCRRPLWVFGPGEGGGGSPRPWRRALSATDGAERRAFNSFSCHTQILGSVWVQRSCPLFSGFSILAPTAHLGNFQLL